MNGSSFIDGLFTKGLGWRRGYSRSVPIFIPLTCDWLYLVFYLFTLVCPFDSSFVSFSIPFSPFFLFPFRYSRLYEMFCRVLWFLPWEFGSWVTHSGLDYYAKSIPSRTSYLLIIYWLFFVLSLSYHDPVFAWSVFSRPAALYLWRRNVRYYSATPLIPFFLVSTVSFTSTPFSFFLYFFPFTFRVDWGRASIREGMVDGLNLGW